MAGHTHVCTSRQLARRCVTVQQLKARGHGSTHRTFAGPHSFPSACSQLSVIFSYPRFRFFGATDWRYRSEEREAKEAEERKAKDAEDKAKQEVARLLRESSIDSRGNHLSNTTCLTRVFFKSGESCGKLWWSLTRRKTHNTNEAVSYK